MVERTNKTDMMKIRVGQNDGCLQKTAEALICKCFRKKCSNKVYQISGKKANGTCAERTAAQETVQKRNKTEIRQAIWRDGKKGT